MRAPGVRDVLVYCRDHHCSHHIRISADRWPDHVRLSDIEDRFVCRVCGKRGADIRPDFPQGRMGTGWLRVARCGAWRMLNAEAVIFMGWNAGTDRRLDR
jgi:hypothetical protein